MRPLSGRWLPLLSLALVAVSLPAFAQPRGGSGHAAPAASSAPGTDAAPTTTAPLTEDQQKAQEHFRRAKELYGTGAYREAIPELEIARTLDPKAKDLVMNLGIVHEKLGKFDEAVGYFKAFLEMEGVTPAERAKVEGIIKRLEGAKKEVPTTPSASASASTSASSTAPPPGSDSPPHGRIDALTITAGSVAVVGLLGGGVAGIYAITQKPSNDFVTGRDGTFANLQDKTNNAHTAAVLADVGLGVGIVASLVTAYLYFGRTKDPAASSAPTTGHAQQSRAPILDMRMSKDSGSLMLRGAF